MADVNILENGIEYNIDLSIDADKEKYIITEISQGTNKGSYLKINLFNNGTEYTVPIGSNYRYFIDGKRPVDNGYILRESDDIIGNSLVFKNISHYITDKVGEINLKLGWQNLNNGLINFISENIILKIKENPFYTSNATDVDEYSLLLDSIGLIGDTINNANTILSNMVVLNTTVTNEENTRKTSESNRVSAEATRQSQEQSRQTNTTNAVNACNTATTASTTATTACNTAKTNAVTATTNCTNATTACTTATTACTTATTASTTATNSANTATSNANTAKIACETATSASNSATTACTTATSACITAKDNAITATNNAITATTNANDATTRANNASKACEDIASGITGINDSSINTSQTWSSSKTISEIVGSINSVTLSSASWVGTTAPYTYTLTLSGITTTNLVEITTQGSVTFEQITAMQNAGIYGYSQSANSLVLKASGDKPTIDLPITVIIKGVR